MNHYKLTTLYIFQGLLDSFQYGFCCSVCIWFLRPRTCVRIGFICLRANRCVCGGGQFPPLVTGMQTKKNTCVLKLRIDGFIILLWNLSTFRKHKGTLSVPDLVQYFKIFKSIECYCDLTNLSTNDSEKCVFLLHWKTFLETRNRDRFERFENSFVDQYLRTRCQRHRGGEYIISVYSDASERKSPRRRDDMTTRRK